MEKLKINQKVDVEIKRGSYQGKYLCKVAEITDSNIKITSPFIRGELVPLRRGQSINVYFTREDAAYMFTTTVIDREIEPVPLISLKPPAKVNRIQRREYFRIDVQRNLSYCILNSDLEAVSGYKETTTIDLSGGGLKMVVDEDLKEETLIELYLDLPELEDKPIVGKVINIYGDGDTRSVGIEFIAINNYYREKIISWLFDYQRKLRQKGLL